MICQWCDSTAEWPWVVDEVKDQVPKRLKSNVQLEYSYVDKTNNQND